jgi:hypothetical protein
MQNQKVYIYECISYCYYIGITLKVQELRYKKYINVGKQIYNPPYRKKKRG